MIICQNKYYRIDNSNGTLEKVACQRETNKYYLVSANYIVAFCNQCCIRANHLVKISLNFGKEITKEQYLNYQILK